MSADQRFFDYLKQRIGLDVASVGPAIIERAVRQRCTALHMATHEDYWQRLLSSQDEQQALIESVIVPETWFFRYPESFVTLGRLARERLAEMASQRTLRILSLPCSTGEEPYSIAMALFDAGLAAHHFKVDALDISPLSVQRAQGALYGKNSFRGQETGFRERYFTLEHDGYQLASQVCEQVSFHTGNLLDPTLVSSHVPYDIVFCRNLLIYFDLKTQQQALAVLKCLTREDGVLFIGPAEGSLLVRLGMRSMGAPQSFAFCHNREPVSAPPAVLAEPRPLIRPAPVTARPFAPRPKTQVWASAPSAIAQPVALLEQIAVLANQGKSREARALCEQCLQQHGPHAQAFYWLGLLSDVEGQTAQAQEFYRKALYLEPQHSEALAHLAALLASRGDIAGAQRLQARAARNGRSVHSERKQ
ncbi:chemotaxis protein methyltransferase WspC [Pseudomonas taetrolens]|uniref:Chemotaxis protein CheR n=1 Tax=Pseudomonas taetrolens TaxID=47884 RepID=A0A0J6GUF0_PSETA|nr:CheR family methyltransferase [Pseudomonas taetrolens]KMM85973.1 chemotaxis protein CheR [Pseudomonas taetrolens]SED03602.1 chemotaxis protein methyltransferase WspC [Pseudomonas taetrolens]SQF87701.1 MCP methyltransferase, CheR-type [Pseudomonas taetrolens]VEH50893.1 MCP methyltransferase, CheR-type [Pseudomonas taetrolens]